MPDYSSVKSNEELLELEKKKDGIQYELKKLIPRIFLLERELQKLHNRRDFLRKAYSNYDRRCYDIGGKPITFCEKPKAKKVNLNEKKQGSFIENLKADLKDLHPDDRADYIKALLEAMKK